MPPPIDQKTRTRARIVEAASRLFRERGYARTSVDDLMGEAGLTRGGFYTHFRSKAALFGAALEAAFAQAEDNLLGQGFDALDGERWLGRASQRYLSHAHVEHAGDGCAIASLGAEVAREEPLVRRAFGANLDRLLSRLAERLGGDADASRARVIRQLATWVGALTIARAVTDPALREEILAACRASEERDHASAASAQASSSRDPSSSSTKSSSSLGQSSSEPSG